MNDELSRTVLLGEPPLKMLRYQQQFTFFDMSKVDQTIHFVNLSQEATEDDLGRVLVRIVEEVDRRHAGIVVVDSFRSLSPRPSHDPATAAVGLAEFIQRLALRLKPAPARPRRSARPAPDLVS